MRKLSISQESASTSLLLDEKQAAACLGVSLSFLRKSRSEGSPGKRTPAPNFVKVGRSVLYRRADLETWVAGLVSRRVVGGRR